MATATKELVELMTRGEESKFTTYNGWVNSRYDGQDVKLAYGDDEDEGEFLQAIKDDKGFIPESLVVRIQAVNETHHGGLCSCFAEDVDKKDYPCEFQQILHACIKTNAGPDNTQNTIDALKNEISKDPKGELAHLLTLTIETIEELRLA